MRDEHEEHARSFGPELLTTTSSAQDGARNSRWDSDYGAGIGLAGGEPANDLGSFGLGYRRPWRHVAFDALLRCDRHFADWEVEDTLSGNRGRIDDSSDLRVVLRPLV